MKKPGHRANGGPGGNDISTFDRLADRHPRQQRTAEFTAADPHEVLWVRAEVRSYLIAAGEIEDPIAYFSDFAVDIAGQVHRGVLDLHEGIDALQAVAVHSGLLADLGQDRVQALMAGACRLAATNLKAAA